MLEDETGTPTRTREMCCQTEGNQSDLETCYFNLGKEEQVYLNSLRTPSLQYLRFMFRLNFLTKLFGRGQSLLVYHSMSTTTFLLVVKVYIETDCHCYVKKLP